MTKVNRKLFWSGVALLALAIGLAVFLTASRRQRVAQEGQRLASEAQAGIRVRTAKVARAPAERALLLTGEAQPYATAIQYAKVSGYLSQVRVDKGDKVKKGQLLAVIESPETDQAYDAAVANAINTSRIAARYKILLRKRFMAPQEAEQAFANARVAQAQVRQAKAMKSYERLSAPFDGTVTARFADPGALIQDASGAQTSAMPVVTVAQVDQLRVYVFVDQRDAPFVRPGLRSEVYLEENPAERWPARIARVSGALDPATRMLLTEIDFDDRESLIVPGSLVKVSITVRTPIYFEIPTGALVIRNGKQFTGVITAQSRIEFRPIDVVENRGETLRVAGNLQSGELVGLDLGSRVEQGAKVRGIASENRKD